MGAEGIIQGIAENIGSDGVIQGIAKRLTEMLKATRCTIRVPKGEILRLMASHGADIESRPKKVEINEDTIAGQAFISGKIVHVKDITKDPRYDLSYIEPQGPREVAAFPVIYEGVCYGVIQVYRKKGFSKRQIAFADILAQTAGPTLYHIETSKMSRQAILDVFDSIFECKTFDEMSKKAIEIISERLEVPSCLIYRIFKKEGKVWCKIVAGVPESSHKIGWEDIISNQPHIESAVNDKKLFVIDDPLNDPRIEHLTDIIVKKGINAMLLDPLVSKNKDDEKKDRVIGVIVMDACREKKNFSAEEKSFAFDGGRMIAQFIDHDEVTLKDFEDSVRNPNHSLELCAKNLLLPLTEMHEITESVCKKATGTCKGADEMCENANKVVPLTTRLEIEAKRVDRSISGIRMAQAET